MATLEVLSICACDMGGMPDTAFLPFACRNPNNRIAFFVLRERLSHLERRVERFAEPCDQIKRLPRSFEIR
jgi:hypothetical protein